MQKDLRRFKRYDSKAEFLIHHSGNTFTSNLLDYSLDGVRVLARGEGDFKPAEIIILDIQEPDIYCTARIIWVKKQGDGLELGLRRLGILYGSLLDYQLSDVMIGQQRSGKTGILYVLGGSVHKNVHYLSGDIIFASSNLPNERFGDLLLTKGRISYEQYLETLEHKRKTNKRLGDLLIDMGYLSREQLMDEVKEHIEDSIADLFRLRVGNFIFWEGPLPTEDPLKIKLSAARLAFKGIISSAEMEFVRLVCPVGNTVIALSTNPIDLFQGLGLSEGQKNVLSLVDGQRTVDEIVAESGLPEDQCLRVLCGLYSTRIVEEQSKEGPSYEIVSMKDVLEAQAYEVSRKFIQDLDFLYENYKALGYYGVLGLKKETATAHEIERAYYFKTKVFHPDKHFKLTEDAKVKLSAIFEYITKAYKALMNPRTRRAYDDRPQTAEIRLDEVQQAALKFEEGKSHMSNRDYANALRCFNEALLLHPTMAAYYFNMGLALVKLGRLKDAEKAVQRALRDDPFNADYLSEAGHIYLLLNLPKRAKGCFLKSIEKAPTNMRAQEGMSVIKKLGI